MAQTLESILADLYHIDPDFKRHEKELRFFIEKLLAATPAVEMRTEFSEDLRRQLIRQAKILSENKTVHRVESAFTLWLKRILFPFTGGILATVLIIAMVNPQITFTRPDNAAYDSSVISQIDHQVIKIDGSLTTCVKTEIPLLGKSSEGGSVTYYHKPKGLQKIKEELLGETGKTINKYFYDQGELIYVIHEIHDYNRPIYWDEKKVAESGGGESFDPQKTVIHQSTYYFEQKHLVRWVDERGQIFNVNEDVTRALQGEFLLKRSDELIWLFQSEKVGAE